MTELSTELSMNVRIFRGDSEIGSGELLPNGANMALCPKSVNFIMLDFEADTEAKIPMEFWLNNKLVAKGELYQSGDNYCLCPINQEIDLINPDSMAKLSIEPLGKNARLDVNSAVAKAS
jgi:hypothetical protein